MVVTSSCVGAVNGCSIRHSDHSNHTTMILFQEPDLSLHPSKTSLPQLEHFHQIPRRLLEQ